MKIHEKYKEKLNVLIEEAGNGTWTESQRKNIHAASNLKTNSRWMDRITDAENRLHILNGGQRIAGISCVKSGNYDCESINVLMKERSNYSDAKANYNEFTPNFQKYLDVALKKIENRTMTQKEWEIFDCLALGNYLEKGSLLGAVRRAVNPSFLDKERQERNDKYFERGMLPGR